MTMWFLSLHAGLKALKILHFINFLLPGTLFFANAYLVKYMHRENKPPGSPLRPEPHQVRILPHNSASQPALGGK